MQSPASHLFHVSIDVGGLRDSVDTLADAGLVAGPIRANGFRQERAAVPGDGRQTAILYAGIGRTDRSGAFTMAPRRRLVARLHRLRERSRRHFQRSRLAARQLERTVDCSCTSKADKQMPSRCTSTHHLAGTSSTAMPYRRPVRLSLSRTTIGSPTLLPKSRPLSPSTASTSMAGCIASMLHDNGPVDPARVAISWMASADRDAAQQGRRAAAAHMYTFMFQRGLRRRRRHGAPLLHADH